MNAQENIPLMDWMRPLDSEGALHSLLLSTYGLSLSDPPFFEQDFIPTILGLGGVRDRGYATPANVERRLGQIYCGLVCDAHALAQGGRPSLRIDVIPVGKQLYHAKVVLIHRERLVRLVIGSANLTHEGFRQNRETVSVLDFHDGSELPPSILESFAGEWLDRLGTAATTGFRRALDEAVGAAQQWKGKAQNGVTIRTIWGGGDLPLWRQVTSAWPQGEVLREWLICSPFWPGPADAETPFDVIRRELDNRGAKLAEASIRLFALAEVPGEQGRPRFPFQLVEQLAQRGFSPPNAEICPVRLDALKAEVPDGKAADQRPLHAKWMLLRGEGSSVLVLGSANFTRRGWGVLRRPGDANAEVCVLLSGPAGLITSAGIMPPIAERGVVRWQDCRADNLAGPQKEMEIPPWPAFIDRIELEVCWEAMPVKGVLYIHCSDPTDFTMAWEKDEVLVPIHAGKTASATVNLDENQVSALLVRRRVVIFWDQPAKQTFFPINIANESRAGLPAVLGQNPTEQDLLAFFHGRIDEDDLMSVLIERARMAAEGRSAVLPEPDRELQNYVVREFLEGLYGMEEILKESTRSRRVFEQALLGEFSPIRLANETLKAFANHRRTAAATAFQFVELAQLIEKVIPINGNGSSKQVPPWFNEARTAALDKLFIIVSLAAMRVEFRESCRAEPFQALLNSVLSPENCSRFVASVGKGAVAA